MMSQWDPSTDVHVGVITRESHFCTAPCLDFGILGFYPDIQTFQIPRRPLCCSYLE